MKSLNQNIDFYIDNRFINIPLVNITAKNAKDFINYLDSEYGLYGMIRERDNFVQYVVDEDFEEIVNNDSIYITAMFNKFVEALA